ncbi:transcription factor TGA2.2-like [Phalaenopsis equestris]|uniref:transcription factor TGA2.2-like n=1 Tax=Phalaenopsis equestris TaxID=78828 RepID=UPI0009E1DCB1|nr:transcription factor TGA2.2-like [Phalaenopsis equestris]
MYSSHILCGMENARNGGMEEAAGGFHLGDSVLDLTRSPILSPRSSSCNHYGGLGHSVQTMEMVGRICFQREGFENGADSAMVAGALRADGIDPFDRIRELVDERFTSCGGGGYGGGGRVSVDSSAVSMEKAIDDKIIRRLAQNREAARKSRLRKKAYVHHLESSRLKLIQVEQELQRARQQGLFSASGYMGNHGLLVGVNGALAFDVEYARWLDQHQNQISDLRSALNSQAENEELGLLVDGIMAHYDVVFKLKSIGTRSDVFHMLSGLWTTPAERCFMWLGGFRSSELLKMLVGQLEPLTDQQLIGICNLQQSSQQAEDALSQGMEALQQSLTDTLSPASFSANPCSDNVANYMNQMAIAMGKLGTIENFLRQADLLRQQTLQQMHRILNTRQAARALLAISDYFSRLRALSSLWLARPRD